MYSFFMFQILHHKMRESRLSRSTSGRQDCTAIQVSLWPGRQSRVEDRLGGQSDPLKDGKQGPEGNLEVMDVFITLTVVLVSQRYTNVKTHQIVHFKHTQLIVPIKLLKEVKAKLFSHLNDELILSSFPWGVWEWWSIPSCSPCP